MLLYPSTASADPKVSPYVPTTSGNWSPSTTTVQAALDEAYPVIRKATLTLADAQIKALPTTAIEIVPSPGVGKRLAFHQAYLIADFSSGYYTNVASTANYGVIEVGDSELADLRYMFQGTQYFTDGKSRITLSSYSAFNPDISEVLAWTWGDTGPSPINITIANNSQGDFSGGHPNNTLKVSVLYTVVDV